MQLIKPPQKMNHKKLPTKRIAFLPIDSTPMSE